MVYYKLLTWHYVSDIPSNDKIDNSIYYHPYEHPVNGKLSFFIITWCFTNIMPLYAFTHLLPSGDVCGTNSKGGGR